MKTTQQLAEAQARAFVVFNPAGHPVGSNSPFYDQFVGVVSHDGILVGYERGVYVSGAFVEGNVRAMREWYQHEYTSIKVKWEPPPQEQGRASWTLSDGSRIEFDTTHTGGEVSAESFIWCDTCQHHAHFCTCDDELPETSDLLDSTAKQLIVWAVLVGCVLFAAVRCSSLALPLG